MLDALIRPFSAVHRAVSSLRCSFCGKSEHEVKKLVRSPRAHLAGPRIHICDGCLEQPHDEADHRHIEQDQLEKATHIVQDRTT